MMLGVVAYSPVGECIRYAVMRRLEKGSATVDEINELVRNIVRNLGVKYDWSIWPKLLSREIVVDGGVVKLTEYGAMLLKARDEIEAYLNSRGLKC